MMPQPAPHWSRPFVGLPWRERGRALDGVDCWGLIRLPLLALGLEVESFDDAYASVAQRQRIGELLRIGSSVPPWCVIPAGRERDHDVAIFRRGRWESHVGLVAGPGLMLHIAEDCESCIAPYRTGYWTPRLIGFRRHAALEAARAA